jgi:aminomethyltransferase
MVLKRANLTTSVPPTGPKAAEVLQSHTDKDLTAVKFGSSTYAKVGGVECHIARGGYTGEDGFEVSSSR